jgi:hypothetical protein
MAAVLEQPKPRVESPKEWLQRFYKVPDFKIEPRHNKTEQVLFVDAINTLFHGCKINVTFLANGLKFPKDTYSRSEECVKYIETCKKNDIIPFSIIELEWDKFNGIKAKPYFINHRHSVEALNPNSEDKPILLNLISGGKFHEVRIRTGEHNEFTRKPFGTFQSEWYTGYLHQFLQNDYQIEKGELLYRTLKTGESYTFASLKKGKGLELVISEKDIEDAWITSRFKTRMSYDISESLVRIALRFLELRRKYHNK